MPKRWETVPPFLVCPLCAGALAVDGASLRCPARHTFDIARDGYVNLLVATQRRSSLRGDSAGMLRARRAFLERGHYAPLAQVMSAAVGDHLARSAPAGPALSVLDAGCATGYYLGHLRAALGTVTPELAVWFCGVDVSREAAAIAARGHPETYIVVADLTRRLPVADESLDALLNVFAPRHPAEFARLLRPGGLLLTVIPSERHLESLRGTLPLLGIEANKRDHIRDAFASAFALESSASVEYEMELSGADQAALLAMTPARRHISEQDLERVAALPPQRTRASFEILRFLRAR
ncbi:MAG TPA: methyltransferase domain-containing protein [Ktedonobacterales bacterium]|nr:methyltransferase domain-containing protein [Ktedonobacterales bacterium]